MGISDVGDQLPGLDEAVPRQRLMKYADKAMYEAAPMTTQEPKVYLLWMTEDPLGAIAAMSAMYEGKVIYDLREVTNEQRQHYWEEMTKTHLNAPLESVKMHFLIEGVDRAFTHQMVRQRTAVYAQESLRFAVKEDLKECTPYPPSFSDPRVASNHSAQNDLELIWDVAVDQINAAYKALIANGVPAEDARGLLPHATQTRLHYVTDLRNLLEHAGNRLCTQAQFHWRSVFLQIREAIRAYGTRSCAGEGTECYVHEEFCPAWQFDLIANTAFVPQCYLQGRCTFRADFDRGCTIRGRVDAFAAHGVPSSEWEDPSHDDDFSDGPISISRHEWAGDPQAGWLR